MDALKGQLRTDFYNLLDDHKHQQQTKLESKFDDDVQKEKLRLEREMDRERTQLTREFDLEKKDLEREINREKDSLLMSSDLDKKNWEREAQLEQKRLVDELTREKTRLEKEWKAERERISKSGVSGRGGWKVGDGEGSVVHETKEVQREVSHMVYDMKRELEKLHRSGVRDACVLGQEVPVVLKQKETISKSMNTVTEKELMETVGRDSTYELERQRKTKDVVIDSVRLETADGKCTVDEHIDKRESSSVERENKTMYDGIPMDRKSTASHDGCEKMRRGSDYSEKDQVLAALTPINPIILENTNFTDKQKEFIQRWRSRSNVKDKIKLFSPKADQPSNSKLPTTLPKTLNTDVGKKYPFFPVSSQDTKMDKPSDKLFQNIYPTIIVSEKPTIIVGQVQELPHLCVQTESKQKPTMNNHQGDVSLLGKVQSDAKFPLDAKVPAAAKVPLTNNVTLDSKSPPNVKVPMDATDSMDVITSEQEQTKIIKEIHKEKEIITRTRMIGQMKETPMPSTPVKQTRPQISSQSSPRTQAAAAKNPPPRKKPRLDTSTVRVEDDWSTTRQKRRDSSLLVSVFSIFLRLHMAKNGIYD